MAIRLDSTDQIPQPISRELRRFGSVLRRCGFVDELLEHSGLGQVAADLNELCVQEGVIGYHYTRALPESIAAHGLQLSVGAERRRDFMLTYGRLFSDAQRKRVYRLWGSYFDGFQAGRDGKIWLTCTLRALAGGGAERLLTFFGGESIFMPLTDDEEIAAVLRTLGQPLVVEVGLPTAKLHPSSGIPWGTVWLSRYHVSINQEAEQFDVDAYVVEPVAPRQVLSIRVACPPRSQMRRWRH